MVHCIVCLDLLFYNKVCIHSIHKSLYEKNNMIKTKMMPKHCMVKLGRQRTLFVVMWWSVPVVHISANPSGRVSFGPMSWHIQ